MITIVLKPGQLSDEQIQQTVANPIHLLIPQDVLDQVQKARDTVVKLIEEQQTCYGINTGFGSLAQTKIADEQLQVLQKRLVLSHASGVGEYLPEATVRLIILLKLNSLCRGFSGVRLELITALQNLLNKQVYPCIPSQGSVGASGDLAPLAHMSCLLLGQGEAYYQGRILPAQEALAKAGIPTIELEAKEGLALINGTQVSTVLALRAMLETKNLMASAVVSGSLSVDAAQGSDVPFDARIQEARGQDGQILMASRYRELLKGSEIRNSHRDCKRVQDPYSLRCQPQVMGSCLDFFLHVKNILLKEANAVSDNPLIFAESNDVLSGGNFHAEPVAMAADTLALVIAEIGALAERRIALLMDENMSGLPAFLVKNSGLNSGFMIAHVTAAALASENKSLSHPACVDSIPTSANQEDHVSMATHGARRLLAMVENSKRIIAIECLAAAQGIEFHRPMKSSVVLENVVSVIRDNISFYEDDRYFADDINLMYEMIDRKVIAAFVEGF